MMHYYRRNDYRRSHDLAVGDILYLWWDERLFGPPVFREPVQILAFFNREEEEVIAREVKTEGGLCWRYGSRTRYRRGGGAALIRSLRDGSTLRVATNQLLIAVWSLNR